MARVPYLTREELPPSQQEVYDRIGQARGGVARVFRAFLNSPELAGRVADVGEYVRFRAEIDPAARETTILAVARELGCQYEFTHHASLARRVGVRDLVIEGIRDGTTRGMIPKESVFVDYAKQVLHGRVNDATFTAIEHLLGRQVAVDITFTIGYYAMLAHTMMALGVELEEGEEPLLPQR